MFGTEIALSDAYLARDVFGRNAPVRRRGSRLWIVPIQTRSRRGQWICFLNESGQSGILAKSMDRCQLSSTLVRFSFFLGVFMTFPARIVRGESSEKHIVHGK